MSTINAEKFGKICDDVWRDRATILVGRGFLSGEDALVRAVYWRLYKVGGDPQQGKRDYEPFLNELIQQYRVEFGKSSAG